MIKGVGIEDSPEQVAAYKSAQAAGREKKAAKAASQIKTPKWYVEMQRQDFRRVHHSGGR